MCLLYASGDEPTHNITNILSSCFRSYCYLDLADTDSPRVRGEHDSSRIELKTADASGLPG